MKRWIVVLLVMPMAIALAAPQLKSATVHLRDDVRIDKEAEIREILAIVWMDAPTEPGVRQCVVSQSDIDNSGTVVTNEFGVYTNRVVGRVITNAAGEFLEFEPLADWANNGWEQLYEGGDPANQGWGRYNVSMAQTGGTIDAAKVTQFAGMIKVPASRAKFNIDVEDQDALSLAYGLAKPEPDGIP